MKSKWMAVPTMALLAFAITLGLLLSQEAGADPHPGQSVNVVIIGGSTFDT